MSEKLTYKVSAIVSTYNSEKFIKGCLEDLTNQTLFQKGKLEIIVINSGSQQDEESIVKEYLKKFGSTNIVYIKTDHREGIYSAWNRGVKAARGEYLTNANTDDRHRNDSFEILSGKLDANPDVSLVYSNFYLTHTPNQQFENASINKTIERPEFSPQLMLEGCFMGPQPMWRASVHNTAGFFNDAYKSAGDYEYWCRMVFLYNMKLMLVPEYLGMYYFNPNGIENGNPVTSTEEAGLIKYSYAYYLLKQEITKNSNSEPTDIIFLTHNRLKYFHTTIEKLIARTKENYNIIIVDNNSEKSFKDYLLKTKILYNKIIFNEKNEWTSAFQHGIDASNSDPFIVSDPDIVVPEYEDSCWLERLLQLHNDIPQLGLAGLNLDPVNKPAKLPDVYLSEKKDFNSELMLSNVGTVMQAIKRKYFKGKYNTDWEVCEMIRQNGGLVGFAKNIIGYHLGWDEERDYPDYLINKFKYFKEFYNADTYKMYTTDKLLLDSMDDLQVNKYYEFDRKDVQALVRKDSKRILDVGCAGGRLGSDLKTNLKAEVWGIEYVEEVALKAKERLDKVLVGSIEDNIKNLPDKYFDTIIFADVLEHLKDPEDVLIKIKSKLKLNGEIIISLPNVRHWSVIKNLLEGRWDYEDAGLLDKTHLRFFTLDSIRKMLLRTGFNLIDIRATMIEYEKIPDKLIDALQSFGIDAATLKHESTHYQYLLKVSPLKPEKELTVIIPVYNQTEYTRLTIESFRNAGVDDYEILLIDNNSDHDTKEFLKGLTDPRINVICNKENLGFPKAVNQGIKNAAGKYLLIANNDILFTENSVRMMLDYAKNNNSIGLIGPMSNEISGPQKDDEARYSSIEEMHNYAANLKELAKDKIMDFPRLAFFCTLIKKEVFEKIGGLDERFTPGNFEDDDFCLRAQMEGYKAIIMKDVFIHHFGSKSFLAEGPGNLDNRLIANRKIFEKKWGGAPYQIWLEGKQPLKKSIVYPLENEDIITYFKRARIQLEEEDIDLAEESLQKCVESFNNKGVDEFEGLKLSDVKNLQSKIKNIVKKD